MKKFLFMLLVVCSLVACGDDNDFVVKYSHNEVLDKNGITDAFLLDSLRGFSDESLYVGNRNNKDWFALYKNGTGEIVQEWYGQERSILAFRFESGIPEERQDVFQKTSKGNYVFAFPKFDYEAKEKRYVILGRNNTVEYKAKLEQFDNCLPIDEENFCLYSSENLPSVAFINRSGSLYKSDGSLKQQNCRMIILDSSPFFFYHKGNKVGCFYKDSLGEWKEAISTEDYEKSGEMDLGYGEHVSYNTEDFRIFKIVNLPSGFAALCPILINDSYYDIPRHDLFIVNSDKITISRLLTKEIGSVINPTILSWYKDSFLLRLNNSKCRVMTIDGLLKGEYERSISDGEHYIAVSYDEYIEIDTWSHSLTKYSLNSQVPVWCSKITRLQDNARVTANVLNASGSAITLHYDAINYDGTKDSFDLKVNIEDGQITYLD